MTNNQPKPNQLGFETDDANFHLIYKQLEQLSKKDTAKNNPEYWLELRSKVYLRDTGECWACGKFVELIDYDLGHLIDKCMGGWDDYDNLAVMHTKCNLSKPRHITLEEAKQWRLKIRMNRLYVPPVDIMREISKSPELPLKTDYKHIQFTPHYRKQDKAEEVKPTVFGFFKDIFSRNKTEIYTQKQRADYETQCAKIKPCTVCWIQGYPNGGAMWRLIPPNERGQYLKENGFVMRRTPKGAKEPRGEHGIKNSLQVINGKLKSEVTIEIGILKVKLSPNGDNIKIDFLTTDKSNISKNGITVGMGRNQIPLQVWENAKAEGISLDELKTRYSKDSPEINHTQQT